MATMTYSGELVILSCWCGVKHAVPSSLRDEQLRQRERGKSMSVYCPLGHSYAPAGESKAEKLEARLGRESEERARVAAERDQAKASARAHKGAATRARKRAKHGVCPCCKRTFKQLAQHMAKKHPDFDPAASTQPEIGAPHGN